MENGRYNYSKKIRQAMDDVIALPNTTFMIITPYFNIFFMTYMKLSNYFRT